MTEKRRAFANSKAENAPDALFIHCQTTYTHMLNEAKTEEVFDEDRQEMRDMVYWEGMLTRLITNKLNLSVPYYTSITSALKRMGCVRQLRRGGGSSPSKWELIKEPDRFLYENAIAPREAARMTSRSQRNAQIDQALRNLDKRLAIVEKVLEKIIQDDLKEQAEAHFTGVNAVNAVVNNITEFFPTEEETNE